MEDQARDLRKRLLTCVSVYVSDPFKSRHSPHGDLRVYGQDTAQVHNTCANKGTTLAERLDAAPRVAGSLRASAGCQYVHCERPSTHRHAGIDLCLDHVLRVMQWRRERGAA